MKIIKGPEYVAPKNHLAGLNLELMGTREEAMSRRKVMACVADAVRAEGYDPDGKAEVGFPVACDDESKTLSVWFYEKLPEGPVEKTYTVIGVYRSDDYERFADVVWADSPERAEQIARNIRSADPDELIIAGVVEGSPKVVL
ncbi:hypothetical protein [Castellaniella sp.]|uniref:hypothetical protein n=1 Tax=Castellaniella sp. TaxID=1955812 RepID=UPI002AFE2D1A|nr:hypothetical protein [Castellaniella sp.]